MYGIKHTNLAYFRSYLTNRIQYISITHNLETDTKKIFCRVPQGSILGPLLFLLYVNDLRYSSKLDPIMSADDTNLFCEHKDLKTFFSLVNQGLQQINEWFEANKLSLNTGKTKYSIVHKPSRKDDLLLSVPKLPIKKYKVESVSLVPRAIKKKQLHQNDLISFRITGSI